MLRTLQTNFTGGILSSDSRERLDIAVWKNGVQQAENVRLHPQGGAERRPGFAFVDGGYFGAGNLWSTNNWYQIEPFIYSSEEQYVFVFFGGFVNIYLRGARSGLQRLSTPWDNGVIFNNTLSVVQSFDTMLVFHKDYPPQRIVRGPNGLFSISTMQWSTFNDGESVNQRPPFHKYAMGHVTMWTDGPGNGPDGYVNVHTSDPFFQAGHTGTWILFRRKYFYIIACISSTFAYAIQTSAPFPGDSWTEHSIEWQEQAFSDVHGWPGCGVRHEQRLWLAGGRDLPSTIFGSTTYDPFNFFLGNAQATDAIKYTADADRVSEIKRMVSYNHLQIYAADGEFFAPTPDSGALTPTNMSVRHSSSYGIANSPAIRFDQTTIFISRAAGAIREFTYDGLQASYSSDALTFMASDLIQSGARGLSAAMETDFAQEALGLVTLNNGQLAVLSKVRKENVGAWMKWSTEGLIRGVGVVNREIWAIIDRWHDGVGWLRGLEVMDSNFRLDFSRRFTVSTPATVWNFPHLANRDVHVRSGDLYFGVLRCDQNGNVFLPKAVQDCEAGLGFGVIVQPLVQEVQMPDGITWGEPKRVCSTTISVKDTITARVDNCRMPAGNLQHDPGVAPDRYTGKFKAWRLGWGTEEAPVIASDYPLPFYLRAISLEVEV